MITIAICDDDKYIGMIIEKILRDYLELKGINYSIKVFTTGSQLLAVNVKFDIVFLDIEMKPMNGIETAKKIKEKNLSSIIIYVTNFSGYRSSAYEVHAFDYIDKPIRDEKIKEVIEDAIEYMKVLKPVDMYTFKSENEYIKTQVNSIYYFEYYMRKVKIVTEQGEYYGSYKLKEILANMSDKGFASPHKSYITNMLHITKINGSKIVMQNGHIIPLSQKQAVKFKETFNIYLQNAYIKF